VQHIGQKCFHLPASVVLLCCKESETQVHNHLM